MLRVGNANRAQDLPLLQLYGRRPLDLSETTEAIKGHSAGETLQATTTRGSGVSGDAA